MEVRPTTFFAVSRIWEKVYDRLMEVSRNNGWLATKIGNVQFIQQAGPKVLEP